MNLYFDTDYGHGLLDVPPKPSIQKNIDGPLLVFSDGQLHWLTILERLLFYFGLTDAERIQQQRRPNLTRSIACIKRA